MSQSNGNIPQAKKFLQRYGRGAFLCGVITAMLAGTLQQLWVSGYEARASLQIGRGECDPVLESRALAAIEVPMQVQTGGQHAGFLGNSARLPSVLEPARRGLQVSETSSRTVLDLSLTLDTPQQAEDRLASILRNYVAQREQQNARLAKQLEKALASRSSAAAVLSNVHATEGTLQERVGPGDSDLRRIQLTERIELLQRDTQRCSGEIAGLTASCAELERCIAEFSDTIITDRIRKEDPLRSHLEIKLADALIERTKLEGQYMPATPPIRNADEQVEALREQLELLGDRTRDAMVREELNPAKREMTLKLERARVELAQKQAMARWIQRQIGESEVALVQLDRANPSWQWIRQERTQKEEELAYWNGEVAAMRDLCSQAEREQASIRILCPPRAEAVHASFVSCLSIVSPFTLLAASFAMKSRRAVDKVPTRAVQMA